MVLQLISLLFFLLAWLPAFAGPDVARLSELHQTPPAAPTEVEVGVYLVGVTQISPPSDPFPTFTAELLVDTIWVDPRLAFDPEEVGATVEVFQGHAAEEVLDRIWWPGVMVENEVGHRILEHQELEIRPGGRVELKERFSVTAHAEVDLRKFPFDKQRFDLHLASFAWDARHVRLLADASHTGWDPDFHNLEWTLTDVSSRVTEEERIHLNHPVSVLHVEISADRHPGFYLYKLLVPLTVIVVFTWSAFWMEGEPSPGKLQRTFVALLTVVAFHHIVAGHLPRISYLTFVDAVVYTCFASVGLTLATVIAIHNATHRGHLHRARQLEKLGRWGQPIGFGATLLVLWIVYHL